MTHEFFKIIKSYKKSVKNNVKTVLATIVYVEGSSYRKEGTQILIDENQNITSALSGGCIEKETIRQSLDVFKTGIPKVFIHDGRYRIGCKGSTYILLELFKPKTHILECIDQVVAERQSFSLICTFLKEEISKSSFGTSFEFKNHSICNNNNNKESSNLVLKLKIAPLNRLCIFGTEYDSEKLSQMATFLGWEVVVIGTQQCNISPNDFPLAANILTTKPEEIKPSFFCNNTAVVIMSHNYSNDLRFLESIITSDVRYIGLLGPVHRKEQLLNAIFETNLDIVETVFEKIHGPVGLAIGSESPEEVSLSIMAEIISIFKSSIINQ